MIIARNSLGRVCLWRYLATAKPSLENLNYDRFFRTMQQTMKVSQAIQIYTDYEISMGSSRKYLGITLRNLTRMLKRAEEHNQIDAVSEFINARADGLKEINLQELSSKEMSDFLVFSLKFAQLRGEYMKNEFKEWVSGLLQHYLLFLEKVTQQERLRSVRMLTTVITPIARHFPANLQDYLLTIFKMYKELPKELVFDNPKFTQLIDALNQLSVYSSQVSEFFENISVYILKEGLVATFECNALSSLLTAITRNRPKFGDGLASENASALVEAIQDHFNESIMTLSGKNIEDSLPALIQNSSHSKFIVNFTEIIARSINPSGRACIHPVFIIQSISYFKKEQMNAILKIEPAWPQHFIKFMQHYWREGRVYNAPTRFCIRQIIQKQLLPEQQLDWLRKNHLKRLEGQESRVRNV